MPPAERCFRAASSPRRPSLMFEDSLGLALQQLSSLARRFLTGKTGLLVWGGAAQNSVGGWGRDRIGGELRYALQ
ncbi:MAG: hypothetical protein RLZ45_255 [Verrucomicrobiota bacterium]